MGRLRTLRRRHSLSRRQFLLRSFAATTAIVAQPLLTACGNSIEFAKNNGKADNVFQHGVASGDPLNDRVIVWTRVTPPAGVSSVTGAVRVFADAALSQSIGVLDFSTDATRDFTVKLDFAGLSAGTTYYYRFESAGEKSPVGRTRTAPKGGSERLRFGVVSCSSYAHGFFNGYKFLAQRTDIDAILHLGDYIYEYGTGEYGDVRPYEPNHEMVTLADYRTRHAYYKREADLMELHRQFPFITTWDDHESTDNSWRDGANNHTEGAEGQWPQRKAFAQQAYDEWMPIRYPRAGDVSRIFRKFSYGDLAEIFILDTRLFDRDAPDGLPVTAAATETGRRMLGPEQMQWLLDNLSASTAKWKIIGQQVVFHQWHVAGLPEAAGGGVKLNGDSWDGYQDERNQIYAALRDQAIDNVVVLTGDVHSSWAADITPDPSNPAAYNPLTGSGSLAVEFVTTSITSPFAIDIPEGQQAFLLNNPHIRYTDWDKKGYLILDLNAERAVSEWWYVSTFTTAGGSESFGTAYQTLDGANHLELLPLTSPQAVPASSPKRAP